MRKVTAILLLSCLVLNATGLSVFFTVQKARFKLEMRDQLNKADLTRSSNVETIIIDLASESNVSSLEWEGSDEFRYKGEMYDVLDKHTHKNQLVIHCISDKKETTLLNQFRKANERDSKQQSLLLARLLSIHFIPAASPHDITGKEQKRVYTNSLPLSLQQQLRKILTPPPQLVTLS